MIRPIYLQPGDKVALVAPSGIPSPGEVNEITSLLKSWELIPLPSQFVLCREENQQQMDANRLNDWQRALDDEEVRAIWCMNGQYGALHIADEADYSTFQGNPKWIIGMDDITVIHAKLYSLGIESLYAFMPSMKTGTRNEAIAQVRNILFGMASDYAIASSSPLNRSGFAEGELIGGNLEWTLNLRATRFAHHTRGTILFIEDATNDLNAIDKNIRCLEYSGLFHHLAGMVVGQFGENATPDFQEKANRIVHSVIKKHNFPTCFNFPTGHNRENYPLILGADTVLSVSPTVCRLCFP